MHKLVPSRASRARLALPKLATPRAIQEFLDALPYSTDPIYRCPASVLRDRRAHCFDGAVLAAAALERIGQRACILDLAAERDDDHVIAPFRVAGLWGAIAKSNTTTLRYREPIHRTLRELVLTYFEFYYNLAHEKSLRSYSRAIALARFERADWRTSDAAMDAIAAALYAAPHTPIAPRRALRELARVDDVVYAAGLLGADPDGLYQPDPLPNSARARAR